LGSKTTVGGQSITDEEQDLPCFGDSYLSDEVLSRHINPSRAALRDITNSTAYSFNIGSKAVPRLDLKLLHDSTRIQPPSSLILQPLVPIRPASRFVDGTTDWQFVPADNTNKDEKKTIKPKTEPRYQSAPPQPSPFSSVAQTQASCTRIRDVTLIEWCYSNYGIHIPAWDNHSTIGTIYFYGKYDQQCIQCQKCTDFVTGRAKQCEGCRKLHDSLRQRRIYASNSCSPKPPAIRYAAPVVKEYVTKLEAQLCKLQQLLKELPSPKVQMQFDTQDCTNDTGNDELVTMLITALEKKRLDKDSFIYIFLYSQAECLVADSGRAIRWHPFIKAWFCRLRWLGGARAVQHLTGNGYGKQDKKSGGPLGPPALAEFCLFGPSMRTISRFEPDIVSFSPETLRARVRIYKELMARLFFLYNTFSPTKLVMKFNSTTRKKSMTHFWSWVLLLSLDPAMATQIQRNLRFKCQNMQTPKAIHIIISLMQNIF
jgi:hypothetical protein